MLSFAQRSKFANCARFAVKQGSLLIPTSPNIQQSIHTQNYASFDYSEKIAFHAMLHFFYIVKAV